jgi:hypothetical protein
MRVGDFGVEVVPRGKGGSVRETDSGHVLARPGQIYALRLRNFGPLRCVADVRIDGQVVTAGGLVIDAWSTEELERPISEDENGCFTVVAEGDERVFGPDGGRDNPDLGLIEVHFRRELPGKNDRPRPLPPTLFEALGRGRGDSTPFPARPFIDPSWSTPRVAGAGPSVPNVGGPDRFGTARALDALSPWPVAPEEPPRTRIGFGDVERAAGTGLTGRSEQRFRPTEIGPLESEATVVQLRLVIGTEEAIDAAHPLHDARPAPVRPAARP